MDAQNKNTELAKKVYEHFNSHNWQAMADLYSEPAEFKDPSFGQKTVMQTRQQIVEKYKEMEGMSPDIHDDIQAVYPSGDKHVVVEFISSGTFPDGTKWTLPICTIMTIENGIITKDYTYYDQPKQD